MTKYLSSNTVKSANIAFHTLLADSYNEKQPHFKSENKVRVSKRLANLATKAGRCILVDFGCGTGFVLELASQHFQRLYGIDITRKMLSKVDKNLNSILLMESSTEAVPLADNTVNVVTANSFLHHLFDIRKTLQEAHRLLKPGGVFFSEEDPNADFWVALKGIDRLHEQNRNEYHEILQKEVSTIVDIDLAIATDIGVDPEVVRLAEYQKLIIGGMDAEVVETILYDVGFNTVNVEYYWYLGQARIMHEVSFDASKVIESYLQSILPLSKYMFKYFRIEAWK